MSIFRYMKKSTVDRIVARWPKWKRSIRIGPQPKFAYHEVIDGVEKALAKYGTVSRQSLTSGPENIVFMSHSGKIVVLLLSPGTVMAIPDFVFLSFLGEAESLLRTNHHLSLSVLIASHGSLTLSQRRMADEPVWVIGDVVTAQHVVESMLVIAGVD